MQKADSIIHRDHEHAKQSSAVTLDNGKKWVANAETSEGIKKMIQLTESVPGNANLHDYHALKEKLEAEFSMILSKCTMTGEAHNQLHNYLLPMKGMFEGLNSPDISVCVKSLEELKQHLGEYDDFFM